MYASVEQTGFRLVPSVVDRQYRSGRNEVATSLSTQ
jgi:hypothetical protein